MDLSGFWNQLLLNATATVCVRPTKPQIIQGVQIISPFVTSTDTNSSLSSESTAVPHENEDEGEEEDNEIIENPPSNVSDESDCIKDEKQRTGSIQRVRYSKEEYRCKQCPYTCTTEKAFLRHSRNCEVSQVNDNHPLSCPICGKDRKDEETLSAHMSKHRQDKYFCCDLCKFKTLQLKKLIQHRRMHTGEKPHLCPFCSYRSSRRDNLRSHVRRMHKKDELPCDTFTPRSMVLSPRKYNCEQ